MEKDNRAANLACDALQSGHLMQTIAKHGFDGDQFWTSSPQNIFGTINGLKAMAFSQIAKDKKEHDKCDWVRFLKNEAKKQNEKEQPVGMKLADFPPKTKKGMYDLVNLGFRTRTDGC